MEQLRKPVFILAMVLIVVVVLVEMGSALLLHATPPFNCNAMSQAAGPSVQAMCGNVQQLPSERPPGLAIPYLALLDVILIYSVVLIGAGILIPESLIGRAQGCATLILALLVILAGIALAFAAFGAVILMIALLMSVPFGTIAYFAIYGFFNRGGATAVLGLLMMLKLGFAVALVVAHQRFLENKGLVGLVLTSLVANVIVSFLQGFPPGFLVSITDAIAAIVVAILAIIWAIILLIGALGAILKALQPQA